MANEFDQFLDDLVEYLWNNTPDGFEEFLELASGSFGSKASRKRASEALGQLLDNLSVLSCADEHGLIAPSARPKYVEIVKYVSKHESAYESKGIRVPCYVKVACGRI
ncbi:MAG: hypothetical protein ACSHX5_08770 [Phycisphaerales bacterium]